MNKENYNNKPFHSELQGLLDLSLKGNVEYDDVAKWFSRLTLDDKCRFLGFADKHEAWKDLMEWHPLGGPDWKLDEGMLSEGIDNLFKQATAEDVIEKYVEWKNDGFKDSETYALATDMTMFMVNKLNEHGIKTVMVPEEKAHEILEKERGSEGEGLERIDFSVRDIMNLSYTWNGEEVSMRGFAEQFMSEIKQKDRTMEDAERIAKAFIEAVKADPEKAGMKMLKAENMANAFRFKLPDGTIYTPEHPLASSPEYETQKGLWLIYENVLGRETMNEFVELLSKNAPMSVEERKRFTELESKVNGSDLMQRSLEVPASKVNENRVRDIRNLIQYFEGNEDYTWTEKALIVKGAMSFGYSEKKESDQTKVEIKNISDNNSVAVPVIGGEAAAVVEGLRKGLNFKDALVQARISLSKDSKRSVERNFTGWKVYRQSDKEEDAVILNQDVAGTGWCTGSAVSTARSHLSGGDFHVYYEAGEPLIAIRTKDGYMAEPPRGAHEGQFCTDREEQIAFDYIKNGNGIIAGDDYIADIEDIRRVMSPTATPKDAFEMPGERRYANGEFGGDTRAWGESVKRRIKELVPADAMARRNLGLYYGYEIKAACRNANTVAIKGDIELFDSASLTVPEGVTRVWNIRLNGSSSLTLSESVTQVRDIWLKGFSSLTFSESVTQVRDIWLSGSASVTVPEGVTQVRDIGLDGSSSLTLSESVTRVRDIFLLGDFTSLTLPEGVTQVRDIRLKGSSSLTFSESVTQVRDISLDGSASVTVPEGVTQVRDISLDGSSSLTLPESVTRVRDIWLGDFTSLTLPESVTRVRDIRLNGSSSLTLHEGVTQVEEVRLVGSSSLILLGSVTRVEGDVYFAPGTSITFPDGFVLRNDTKGKMHYTSEKINKILSEHQKKTEFRLSNGTIYGYQLGDTIYLTPKGINPNTPIHEYAHLWAKVYEKLHPDEWESLKEELKTLPQWREIAESESYFFIESDENRLAGEVLATIVGNKGEELMLSAARDTLKEGERTDESVAKGAEYFRRKVTDMAVKDVFDAEGMDRTGEVTLKVLKDFAEGKGVKMSKEEGERLAAMAGTSSSGDKLVRVVDIMPDKSISGKSDILAKIPSGGIVVFNEESNAGVTVSRKAIRHSLQRLNETTIACAYNIEKIINNAKLLGNLPVAIDEIEHTRAVMVYYCPVRIGEELISARLLIKQLENNGRVIESLSFYNITPHKKREASPVPNVKGFPGVYSDDKLSSCKIKDIIHNTQDYDKILAGIETETSFHIDKDAIPEFTYNNNPNMTNLDFVSYAASDISKAALFVAWEIRDDNPYEFVANLSRAELEDFLKNSFEKLNAEDKDIVTNILNKAPGYDEDFVEKRINRESQFNPDIETRLVDDLTVGGDVLDRSMFYIATRNMNDEQVQALRDSVKEKVMAYYAGIEMDAPNASMEKAEAYTEKLLNSWFRPWTRLAGRLEYHLDKIQNGDEGPVALRHIEAEARDAMTDERYAPYIERELKGWIRNRCADYGLDYTKLPEDLQYEGAAETYRQMYPEYVKDTKIDTLTRDAILAHIDKITALYPQYPQDPTKVSRKPDGSIVRQYGEFEYEQLKGGFERSKNLVLVEEIDGKTLQKKALYSMSSDSYGEHLNGPYVRFWDNGNIRSYENRLVRVGSDNEFESDMLSFTREGIVQEKIPGDYPIDFFLEDITNEYMETMTQREGLEPNATANKIDSALLSTWFISLPLEDKMRVFSFYHYTPGVEESPIGVLDNNDDVKVLNKTYEAAIGVPIDIPEVDESVVRASIEKMLVSAFESISDTSKAQVYRDVVASGLPANTLMTNATNIKIASPERKEQLLALSPNDPGARMLEDMYEYNLLWDGINPRTPGKIQEEIAAAAKEAKEIIIVTPTSESLSWQITNLILKDELHDGDKIFIRDERMNELKTMETMEISFVRKEPDVEYDLKYSDCSLSVFLHDNGTIKSCVEHYGKDLLGNHVDGAVYHFAKSGMLLSAEKGNAVQSPVHAIEELQKMMQENIGKMNVLEIAGLRDLVAKLNEPLSYFRHEMYNGDHMIGVSTRSSIDDRMGAFKELQDTIERNYEKARSEFFEYAGRGFRANNNLWDRLMRRTFTPTYPLPPMDDLKIEGRQYKQGAVSLDEIGTDKIPLDFYNRFLDRCLQPGGPDIDVNAMPKMPIMSDAQVFDKKQETIKKQEKHRSDLRAKAENRFQKMLDKAFCNKETESKSIGRGRVK